MRRTYTSSPRYSQDEQSIILEHGYRKTWDEIAEMLPGRAAASIRVKYYNLKRDERIPAAERMFQAEAVSIPPPPPRYPLLHAIVDLLPASREWTEEERERWLRLLTAALDFYFRVIPTEEEEPKP